MVKLQSPPDKAARVRQGRAGKSVDLHSQSDPGQRARHLFNTGGPHQTELGDGVWLPAVSSN